MRCPAPLVRPCAVSGLLQRIGELERDLEGLRGEAQKYCAERDSVRKQLAEKAKVTLGLWGCGRGQGGTGTAARHVGRGPASPGLQPNVLSSCADPEGRRYRAGQRLPCASGGLERQGRAMALAPNPGKQQRAVSGAANPPPARVLLPASC